MRSGIITTLVVGSLGALLLPGALALVACLLWVHAQRYRALHGRILATLGQHRRWSRSQAAAVP
ncbi:MAG: hypothetical protein ACTHMK_11465 [Dyella sp.]|uniref:hypothetical protein n=1 Tax=Dyella sp. TaxID=1869338 RepID=UPI003F8084A9